MPQRKGSANYKNDLPIDIVAKILLNGEYGWQTVAIAYQEQSKENILCDSAEMKKHWIRTLCNGMKKPTGRTGEVGDRIHQCMGIEKKIMQKTHSGIMGFSSSEDESTPNGGGAACDIENALRDSFFGGGSSSGGGGEDNAINESVESARDTNDDRIDISLPKISVLPPICQRTQDGTGNKGVEKVTPRMPTNNICAGLKRTKSSIWGQRTKNLSNKNKECTLIAGAIIRLVERQDLGSGLAANMSMLMMRQLEALKNNGQT
jgi:hypothetical protein